MRQPKRRNYRFNNDQSDALEENFQRSSFMSKDDRINLANALNLTEFQVRNWFTRRRAKERIGNRNNLDVIKCTKRSSQKSPSTDTSSRYSTPSPAQWDHHHQINSPGDFITNMPENTMQNQYYQTFYSQNYMPYAYPVQPTPLTCASQNVQPHLSSISNENHEMAYTFESSRSDCVWGNSTESYDLTTANLEQFIQQNANTPQQVDFIDQNECLNLSIDFDISKISAEPLLDLWRLPQMFEVMKELC